MKNASTLALRALGAALPFALAAAAAADSGPQAAPTFAKEIAPIFMNRCAICHRPNQIAPMSLLSYEDARPWAKSIREAVAKRTMPPWHADSAARKYANDRSLAEPEIAAILAWVDAGAPKGNDADMPVYPAEKAEWTMGKPDMVLGMDAAYEIGPQGEDDYRCFVLDPKLDHPRWVVGLEVKPGNPKIDHHIAVAVDDKGIESPKLDAAAPGPGYPCFGSPGFNADLLGGWAPGAAPRHYAPGVGHLMTPGAKIVMQMHYHRSGKPETDQTKIGLMFSDADGLKPLRDGYVPNFKIEIPAGEADYRLTAQKILTKPVTVYSVAPHMHLLGKSMEMWAELPDGSRETLFRVPRYDFNWQNEYVLAEPLRLPKGTRLKLEASYDNSAASPNQPSKPPKVVGFGENSTDEMCFGLYFHTVDEDAPPASASAGR